MHKILVMGFALFANGALAACEGNRLVYLTGYSYWDNTPSGSTSIAWPVINKEATGSGTYEDPVVLAVSKEDSTGIFKKGTRLYIHDLQKYVIVEDYCVACTSNWIDIWIDGRNHSVKETEECMRSITGNKLVTIDPPKNLPVIAGTVMETNC